MVKVNFRYSNLSNEKFSDIPLKKVTKWIWETHKSYFLTWISKIEGRNYCWLWWQVAVVFLVRGIFVLVTSTWLGFISSADFSSGLLLILCQKHFYVVRRLERSTYNFLESLLVLPEVFKKLILGRSEVHLHCSLTGCQCLFQVLILVVEYCWFYFCKPFG